MMTVGDIGRTAALFLQESSNPRMVLQNEGGNFCVTQVRSVRVREVPNPYSGVNVLIIGSSYDDCDSFLKERNYHPDVFNVYLVWDQDTLRCHDGLMADVWHKTDSANFYLWAQSMELYIRRNKTVVERISSISVPLYDEAELVPCQFPEFHTT